MTNKVNPNYGGYRNLKSFQSTTIIYDLTVIFCEKYVTYKSNKSYRMIDQMVQAARSGRQNIAEGSKASATSKKTEIKLLNVARASLEELLLDYEDFLRQKGLKLWEKDSPKANAVRALAYKSDRSCETYKSYLESPETAANCLICLINQANYLLDRQLASVEKEFLTKGGYTEKLFKARRENRNNESNGTNKNKTYVSNRSNRT
ncbi:MAG: four helix bundle protein [Candidatus Levybacteria bacterium CG_4_9_14_3_um_filter_35_16]|nr:MAG: four helix bundle protein [Candidatus Levybacteria bacterium CG_4_9_14_3_um_filter_35_16]